MEKKGGELLSGLLFLLSLRASTPETFRSRTVRSQLQEICVDGCVARKLGVESCGEDVAFLDKRGLAFEFGKDLDLGGHFFDDRSPNEDHFERLFLERGGAKENVTGKLAAVAVAEDGHVQKLQRVLLGIFHLICEKNGAGASPEDRSALLGEFENGIVEPFFFEKLELRGAFAARKNEATATIEVSNIADFDRLRAELTENCGVGFEVALDR